VNCLPVSVARYGRTLWLPDHGTERHRRAGPFQSHAGDPHN
jgi:hypothetical protein